jgi:hypothetical protein
LRSGGIVVGQTQGTDGIKSTKERIIYQSKKKKKKNDAGRAELLFARISRLQGFACFFNKTNKKWLAYCPSLSMSLKPHHGHVK